MYDAKFTAGGLLFNEFRSLRELIESEDFDRLAKQEEEQNMLMAVSMLSSRKRILNEVRTRRDKVPKEFWNHYYNWSEREQKMALFYLCLKSYRLLLDMHLDIALKKYRIGADLTGYDVQMWLDDLSTRDEKVASWSEKTHYKINTQYRRMLKDAGLLDGERLTAPSNISNSFREYFTSVKESWFLESSFLR